MSARPESPGSSRQHLDLILFIAGDGPNSTLAQENLRKLREAEPEYHFQVKIVNVLSDFRLAQEHRVLVTPSLILVDPAPRVMVVGNLKDADRVRTALRLPSIGTPGE